VRALLAHAEQHEQRRKKYRAKRSDEQVRVRIG
jgi:hypothetical protein